MCQEMGVDEVTGRNLVISSVIVRYVTETLKRDIELLEKRGEDYFTIIGLERKCSVDMYGLRFYGVMDRVDRIGGGGPIRVVDYKSGSDDPSSLATEASLAEDVVEAIFSSDYDERKPHKAVLQFFIYDKMLEAAGMVRTDGVVNSMYATSNLFVSAPGVYGMEKEFARDRKKVRGIIRGQLKNIRSLSLKNGIMVVIVSFVPFVFHWEYGFYYRFVKK